MAKTIQGNEVIVDNHLQNAITDAKTLKKAYEDLDKVLVKLKTDSKSVLKGSFTGSINEIKAITEAYKLSNTTVRAKIELDKQLRAAEDEVVKGKLRLQEASATQRRLLKEEIALEDKQIGTLKRLEIENARLTRERKNLNLETKAGTDRLKEINAQLDKNNKIIKSSGDAMTKQRLNIGNYQSAVGKLTNALSQLGLAFSAFTLVRDAFNTVVDFDKATASLSAITGATGKDLEDLKSKVTELSDTMKISATDATKLFEIVGSQMPQLLKDAEGLKTVAESAVILSKASGDTVEESTRALANVMNQFSLGADQAERAMNVLAAGSLVGSAGISDVSESMKNFGSVAAGANISVEESVALVEVLGKFGLVGAESGTKLRGSILKLQQASFGYASGQFEVNDALKEAKEKFDSLGTAIEKDAFLQKTFGTENISTGKILLANIPLFNEYTAGVTGTNTATDQAAINSDTLSTVIKELKAAWENLIIKWSDGTDVAGGLKSVLRFLAENLETIVTWVMRAVTAWGAYKVGVMISKAATALYSVEVDKAGKKIATGLIPALMNGSKSLKEFGQSLKSIGFAGWLSILTVVIPLLWDMGKALYESFNEVTALDRVTEKYNSRMEEERSKMDLLRYAIQTTTAGSKERQKVIDEINSTYGVTLQNLEDETAFMNQLYEAYKLVNAELERKIMNQLMQDELTALFKQKRELEKIIADGSISWYGIGADLQTAELKKTEEEIANLQKEMYEFNQTAIQTGKTLSGGPSQKAKPGDIVGEVKDKVDKLAELRRKHAEDLILFENESIKAGYDRQTVDQLLLMRKKELLEEELVFIQNLNLKTREEYDKTYNERIKLLDAEVDRLEQAKVEKIDINKEVADSNKNTLVDAMVDANKEFMRLEQEAMARRKKMYEDSIALLKKITEAMVNEYDTRIEKEKESLAQSDTTLSYLREQAALGNTDAAKSIKAEEIARARQMNEIEALERKKRNLLVITTGLEAVSQKINSGDSNAFQNVGTELANFIAKLPKFYSGTETTVADALGKPHLSVSKDAYLARVHGNEMIHGAEQSAKLQAAGFTTTSDIANAALAYSSGVVSASNRFKTSSHDSIVVSELKQVKQAIKDIPGNDIRWDEISKSIIHQVKQGNKITRNHHKPGGLFS